MTRRRLEFAVLAFGAVFLVVIALSFRPGRRPTRGAQGGERLPRVSASEEAGEATTVLKGFDYTETLRGKPLFRIRSERTVGFGPATGLVPNVYVLEKVALTVYPEQGQPITIHSDRAEYDQRSKQAKLSGNVRWTDERGALGETATLEFDPSRRLLASPGPIHFTRGTFDLTAPSGHYDMATRRLLLDGPVRGAGTGEGSGGLTSLVSDAAVYQRDESVLELSGHVEASSRQGDRLSCERLVLKLGGEEGHLQWARAEGHVVGTLASPTSAAARVPAGPRRYSAHNAGVLFDIQGQARSLSLVGDPAEVSDARGRLRAATIDVSLASGRATSATALGGVHVDTHESHADSQRASLSFNSSGDIETMELSGNVRMVGEDRSARAEKAVNLPERAIWILTGEGRPASVEGGGAFTSAARIEIDQKRRLLTADGNAQAVFREVPAARSTAGARRVPALVGDPSKPTFGKARRMVFDDAARVATLSGAATLWQEGSSLSGDDITLNDIERTAVAVGNTRTVMISSAGDSRPRPQPHKGQGPAPTVVTAHRVTYQEKDSRATFDGTVIINRGDWRASAEHAFAVLGKDRKIERVEMSGDVALSDSAQGRSGRADQATDWPPEGRTVLQGKPAWVSDATGNRVSGAVLTITDGGRRVEVTAPPGGKTETIHRTRAS